MSFMDKVKATAEKVGEKAQHGVQHSQQKLSDAQERKRVDGLLRDLGAACYHDRTGRGTPAVTSEIERLTATLRDAEAGGATIELNDGAAPNGAGDDTPAGSYTLDDV
jgi:hypothetical protein